MRVYRLITSRRQGCSLCDDTDDRGIFPYTKNTIRETIELVDAVRAKDMEQVKHSLEKGASPNGKINDGSELSVMHFAVHSTTDIVLFLISQNGSIFNCDAEKTSVYEQLC